MAYDWDDRDRGYGRSGYRDNDDRREGSGGRDRDWSERGSGREDRGGFWGGGYGGYADRGVSVGGSGGYDYGRAGGRSGSDYGSYGGGGSRWSDYGGQGADRDYGRDYGAGRDTRNWGRDYGGGGSDERGFLDRAGDEVASWFGDEDAERRRRMDHRGRGPKGYSRSDDRIREDVSDRLSDDPHIDASEIEVSVKTGEVTLSGTVQSRFDKRHAEDIAERVSGVRHVQNNLRVSSQTTTGETGLGTGTSGTIAAGSGRRRA